MNYGKFFKINLTESVDGVTIYDYVDLPAYFGEPKKISPKYPVSAVITNTAVRFRLHYCAYKYGDGQYAYDIVDNAHVTSAKTVHLDEVILELPFADNTEPASSVLTHIYSTRFPLLASGESKEDEENVYLAQLLNKRYGQRPAEDNLSDADRRMYQDLRDCIDGDRSFSSIWLMGLRETGADKTFWINLKDAGGKYYIGFLRKLVLDFMFDLKHTDVFQNSADYERMYSGLMSDFMFSSLMHKCEYYYNRGLIVDAIDKAARHGNPLEEKNNIRQLYAPRLFESERIWIDDIMNPQAEKVFCDTSAVQQQGKDRWAHYKRALATVFSPIRLKCDANDSWFNNPEEELRRVCFTMRGKNEEMHLCNTETVAEYITIHDKTPVHVQRSRVSRWFLKRNAFVDAFHVHFPRLIDYLLPVLIVALAGIAVFCGEVWTKEFWHGHYFLVFNSVVATTCIMSLISLILMTYRNRRGKTLPVAKVNIIGKRLLWWTLWLGTAASAILCLYKPDYSGRPFQILALVSAVIFLSGSLWANVKIIPNIHLTYPRLIASIAAAWFTLAIGNELFISFFDVIPSALACALLSLIVFIFVLYNMNKDLPNAPSIVKFARGIGVLAVSLCLSIVIGIFVINFVGERFLERNGNLGSINNSFVAENRNDYESAYGQTISVSDGMGPASSELQQLSRLESSTVAKAGSAKEYPVATVWTFANGYRLFILNGFLIQFAFLAMFIGVFIQMIFEEKSLNEL